MFRVVLMVGLLAATFAPLYLVGSLPPPSNAYVDNFERLWHALDAAYPYFAEAGVNWNAMRDAYRPRVAQAANDIDYANLVDEMLAALNDGHTGVLTPAPRRGRTYFGVARALSDGIVIDQIGPTGQRAGLARGDRLVDVGGRPVEEALLALPAWLRAGSTEQHRRAVAARNVLSSTERELAVAADHADGRSETVILRAPTEAAPGRGTAVPAQEPASPVIVGRRLPSGFGYIQVPTLSASSSHDLVREFDAALGALSGSPGLILDLRGNGGGDSRIGDRIAGRFVVRRFVYGVESYRLPLPQRLWVRRFPYAVRPRGETYDRPLVLLIDSSCFSSAEMLIVALVDSGRATAVGRPTGGGSGNPVTFALPNGGQVRFSTGAFHRSDGTLIEGVGIAPDVLVSYTVADFRAGRDPDLEAAEAVLSGQTIAPRSVQGLQASARERVP
ncbi:MAG: S41 family peptidase [Candidatus Bipolaricaulis sp.]|nr:S41 family peptidase [Candidatus Bipolaricaulis sp.]